MEVDKALESPLVVRCHLLTLLLATTLLFDIPRLGLAYSFIIRVEFPHNTYLSSVFCTECCLNLSNGVLVFGQFLLD